MKFRKCDGLTKEDRYLRPCSRLGKRYHRGHRFCTNHKKFYIKHPELMLLDMELKTILEKHLNAS